MLEGSSVPQPGSFVQGWDLVMAILIGGFLYAGLGTAYNVKVKQMPLVRRTMMGLRLPNIPRHVVLLDRAWRRFRSLSSGGNCRGWLRMA
eukprot:COSAG04_NODE_3_length_53939_cov_50.145431_9_plen_90_part_00